MASGGMDTLPHNGAVITLLAVTGLTHKEAYKDIFVITLIKSAAVFFVIGVFYLTVSIDGPVCPEATASIRAGQASPGFSHLLRRDGASVHNVITAVDVKRLAGD
jgi:hypothetical protein